MSIVVEAIAGDLFSRKLKVALLVHICCVFSSEKEIAVDEAILNQGLENVSGAVRSARIKHFFIALNYARSTRCFGSIKISATNADLPKTSLHLR